MRRILAFVFISLCGLQPSLAAAAAIPVTQPVSVAQIASVPVPSGFTPQRSAAMRAPMPTPVPRPNVNLHPDVGTSHFAIARPLYGSRAAAPTMLRTLPNAMKVQRRDPLAKHAFIPPSHLASAEPTKRPAIAPQCMTYGARKAAIISPCLPTPSPTYAVSVAVGGVTAAQFPISGNLVLKTVSQGNCAGIATLVNFVDVEGNAVGTCTASFSWTNSTMGKGGGNLAITVTAATPPPSQAQLTKATTGVDPWWQYSSKSIPGVGSAMVNVANGNLLVQATDVDIPVRGFDMVFQRTYNSQSAHDGGAGAVAGAIGTDGAMASVYGNGWTSTLDMHLAYNDNNGGIMSIYDVDGARYDYTANGFNWNAPAGLQGTSLTFDGSCGYIWTKKDGTSFYFYSPVGSNCASSLAAGYRGRLYEIIGRNQNNYLFPEYSWVSGDASSPQNLAGITVLAGDGEQMTLSFAKFGNYTELQTLKRPDGQTITYNYDTSGNLLSVTKPALATDEANRTATISSTTERYAYYPGTHQLQSVAGPRYVWSQQNTPNSPDGGYFGFEYSNTTTAATVTAINQYAVVNPSINDGTPYATPQPYTTGYLLWHWESWNFAGGSAALNDSDGHSSIWTTDSSGRVTQLQQKDGSIWLVTSATWDQYNELTSVTDPRNHVTAYGYTNGDLTLIQEPTLTTNVGSGSPIARFAYDQYHNLIAYCDPSSMWPNLTSCSTASATRHYAYNYSDGTEPFGYLTDIYTPQYHRSVSYSTSAEGGDFGLPTGIIGDPISQSDTTYPSRTPTVSWTYDQHGDVVSMSNGVGTTSYSYDCNLSNSCLHEMLSTTDADGVTTKYTYGPEGNVLTTQTAAQAAAGVSEKYLYDADGNVVSESSYSTCTSSCTPQVTVRTYDGEDRLLEVMQPHDSQDLYTYGWITRYLYDLTAGGTVSPGVVAPFKAYGNLYATQLYFAPGASGTVTPGAFPGGTPSLFKTTIATAYDMLDRVTNVYDLGGQTPGTATRSYQYDSSDPNGNSRLGLLAISSNGAGQTTDYRYDSRGVIASTLGSDGLNFTYTRDPDGRPTSIAQSGLGTESFTYDTEGRLATDTTPAYGAESSPTTINYGYFPNGQRSTMGVSSPNVGINNTSLFTYTYRPDGLLSKQTVSFGGTYAFGYGYSNAGRLTQMSDPTTGGAVPAATTAVQRHAMAADLATAAQSSGLQSGTYSASSAAAAAVKSMAADATPASGTTLTSYGPITFAYDGTGRLVSEQLATGQTYSGISYDLEDEVTAFQGYGGLKVANTYDVRGELLGQHYYQNGQLATSWPHFGLLPSLGYMAVTGDNVPSGMANVTEFQQLDNRTMQTNQYAAGFGALQGYQYQIDSAGRQSKSLYAAPYYVNAAGQYFQGELVRSYDSRDNLQSYSLPTSDAQTGAPQAGWPALGTNLQIQCNQPPPPELQYYFSGQAISYKFNPAGKVISANYSYGNHSVGLHWDGSAPLFSTNPSGKLDYIRVGLQAVISSSGALTMTDRDWNGDLVEERTGQGYSAWAPIDPHLQGCTPSSPPPGAGVEPTAAPLFAQLSADTVTDGFNFFAGVRTYDPSAGQWTSPDSAAGDPSDPLSQQPYVWNRNNPNAFTDPTGLYATGGGGDPGDPWGGDPWSGGIPPMYPGPVMIAMTMPNVNPASLPPMIYKQAIKFSVRKLWEAHHLIPQRFAQMLRLNPREMLAKMVEYERHKDITRAWQSAVRNARAAGQRITPQWVRDTARTIAKDFPELMEGTEQAIQQEIQQLPEQVESLPPP